ncbi:MAG: hypothetical protein LAN71_01400 [Acidobacteriia bacterium]|nr:hypothetical protein [Terriglobia bacterium]
MDDSNTIRERALTASAEELSAMVHHPDGEVLRAILQNPAFNEAHLLLLLERKDLSGEILEEVARRRFLLKNYRIKRAIVFHSQVPRLVCLRLLRDLYLMDLVQFTLSVSAKAELKIKAEEQLLARLPQLPLGQKVTLARRGPGRLAATLLAEGHPRILEVVLDNPYLNEGHLLKALSHEKLPEAVIVAVARHRRWSVFYNVRIAIVRHPRSPLAVVLGFLPHITLGDLRELVAPGLLADSLRNYLQAEIARRLAPPSSKPIPESPSQT